MKLTIYLDILLVTNIIINYFLLKTTVIYSKANVTTYRIVAASFVGALFSIVIFLDIPFFISVILKICSVLVTAIIAFGTKQKLMFIKSLSYMIVESFCFTGLLTMLFQNSNKVFTKNMNFYMNINPLNLVACIVIVYRVVYFLEDILESSRREYIYDIEILYMGKTVKGSAFFDTGFSVKDIVTFKPVLLCNYTFIENLLLDEMKYAINLFYSTESYNEKRIVPVFYSDLNGSGMLPGITAEKITVSSLKNKKTMENVLVAVTKNKISEDFDVIFGNDIYSKAGVNND